MQQILQDLWSVSDHFGTLSTEQLNLLVKIFARVTETKCNYFLSYLSFFSHAFLFWQEQKIQTSEYSMHRLNVFNVNFEHIQRYVYENNYDEDFLWN